MDYPLAFAIATIVTLFLAFVLARAWRLSNRSRPNHCASCGRRLQIEEMEHYGHSCEACEEKFLNALDRGG